MPWLGAERPGHVAPGVLLVSVVASVHTEFSLASRAAYLLEPCALVCLSSGEQK